MHHQISEGREGKTKEGEGQEKEKERGSSTKIRRGGR